jgi:hypothetical protein
MTALTSRTYWAALAAAVVGVAALTSAHSALQVDGAVELQGKLAHDDQLSGVALWQDLLIACPDEGAEFNVLRRTGEGYDLVSKVNLLDGEDDEIDMEGAASDGKYIYIVGSHSMRRKEVDDDGDRLKNRKKQKNVKPHEASYSLFRITLDEHGKLLTNESISLKDILEADEILAPYVTIPGKENGIDVEGIAVKDGMIYVGFRGPVLRQNFVPVLRFRFDAPQDYTLQFVKLDGRGIRDLAAVDGGFLVLAGPVGDGDSSYQLHLWNGEDCIPGDAGPAGRLTPLGELRGNEEVKPEALAAIDDRAAQWRLLLLRDGDSEALEVVVAKP